MKTTMNIPKDLLKEAISLSGAASQTMAVILGLQELIKKKRLENLASMQGKGAIRLSSTEMKILRSR
jgi:hypothetical protein